jgi:hypothetical protein
MATSKILAMIVGAATGWAYGCLLFPDPDSYRDPDRLTTRLGLSAAGTLAGLLAGGRLKHRLGAWRRWVWGLTAGWLLLLLFIPSVQYPIRGVLTGEPFYRGMPASYWATVFRRGDQPQRSGPSAFRYGVYTWLRSNSPRLAQHYASWFLRNRAPDSPVSYFPNAEATAVLMALTNHSSPVVRREAVHHLRFPKAIPTLIKALVDDDALVRLGAAESLCQLGRTDLARPAVPGLLQALRVVWPDADGIRVARVLLRIDPETAWREAGFAEPRKDFHPRILAWARYVKANPGDASALNSLAWYLATSPDVASRDGRLAVALAQEACQRTAFQSGNYLDTLAAAYAEAGDFAAAVKWQEEALRLHAISGGPERLRGYRERQPYRESH